VQPDLHSAFVKSIHSLTEIAYAQEEMEHILDMTS